MDVLIQNGDVAARSSGDYIYINGLDEAVQRVRIAALTVKGSFIYDRGLGTDYGSLSADDDLIVEKLDMLIKEACCDISDADVETLSFNSAAHTAVIRVTYRGEATDTEVDLTGIL